MGTYTPLRLPRSALLSNSRRRAALQCRPRLTRDGSAHTVRGEGAAKRSGGRDDEEEPLARVALLAAVTLAAQVVPVHGHDDGLTCHDHPTGGWKMNSAMITSYSFSSGFVRIRGHIQVVVDEVGGARITARGGVTVDHALTHDRVVLTIVGNGATMACSDVGMTRFDLALTSPRTERGSLAIVPPPSEPIREPGRHAVRFILDYGSGVAEHDGFILVVAAADGPMP